MRKLLVALLMLFGTFNARARTEYRGTDNPDGVAP